jgi:hypothetical protein
VPSLDETYKTTYRHADPDWEFRRIHFYVHSGFHVLANLGEIDDKNAPILKGWILTRKPPSYDCRDMYIWLIDCYARFTNRDDEFHRQHRALAAGKVDSTKTTLRSKWDAPWDRDDPMLMLGRINTSDLATIEVLALPEHPLNIDEPTENRIIQNFLDSVPTK